METRTKNQTEMKMSQWLQDDAVVYDLPVEEILLELIYEGIEINDAIDLIEKTQNVKIN